MATTDALSTIYTFLMKKKDSGSDYEKVVDIKSYPDMGGEPNMLETTHLSTDTETFIPGVKRVGGGLEFTCNYNPTDYAVVVGLEGEEKSYALYSGGTKDNTTGVVTPTGSEGKWTFKGQASVKLSGGGVDDVMEMVVTIAPSTPVVFSAS